VIYLHKNDLSIIAIVAAVIYSKLSVASAHSLGFHSIGFQVEPSTRLEYVV